MIWAVVAAKSFPKLGKGVVVGTVLVTMGVVGVLQIVKKNGSLDNIE